MKCVFGSAVQFRPLSSLKLNGKQLFSHRVAQHWTPHSGRNFLPSATAPLGHQKTDKEIFGGLSAQAINRYTLLAKQRFTLLQIAAADSFSNPTVPDSLAEAESVKIIREFMTGIGIQTVSTTSMIDLLSARPFASVQRVPRMIPQIREKFEPEEILVDDAIQQDIPEAKPDKRRRLENTRVHLLGTDPQKV